MHAMLVVIVLSGCESAIGRSKASQTVPTAARPAELAAGDLDGDGRVDLVVAGDGTIGVRLQRDGGWIAPPGDPLRARAHMIALGDLDADGALDLVTTDHDSGDVGVFFGTRAGSFGAPTTTRAVSAEKPHNHGLVVADLDRDGDADVVVADQSARQIVVLLSEGRVLHARSPIALPAQPYPPAAGDLDGDGTLDLVVPLVGGRAIAVLAGDGTGGFAAPRMFATTRERPYGVALGDIDGNGTIDVLVTHDDLDTVVVMAGDGKGALAESRALDLPARLWTPLLVDLDGDRTIDLVGATGDRLVIARGVRAPVATFPAGSWRVIAVDLDGDGRPELASPETRDGVVRLWKL